MGPSKEVPTLMSWTPENVAVAAKPKHSLLPLLVTLFLISYGLLAMLVVEQGRTIENQRSLIQALFNDSNQLSHMKGKALQEQRATAQAQAEARANSAAQSPSAQAQSNQTPSNQVAPGNGTKNGSAAGKLHKRLPEKPPQGTADNPDDRRTVLKI
jgi:hypothetical protein